MGNLTRTIIDTQAGYNLTALPAENTSVQSATIDLQQAPSLLAGAGTSVAEDIQISMSLPAIAANTVAAQSVTGTLQDSADGITFANVAGAPVLTATSVAVTGSVAVTLTFIPPLTIRRYLQVTWAVSATAGNLTASSGQFNLAF
jgi:hypothetical protein